MQKISALLILLFFSNATMLLGALDSHPRVLLTQNDIKRITTNINTYPQASDDFDLLLNNKNFINTTIPYKTDITTLRRLLNKIMKNSFIYLMGSNGLRLQSRVGYETSPEKYMQFIEDDLITLIHPDSIKKIQSLGGHEAAGYAVKSLAIAYDWGFDYFINNNKINTADLENALRQWAAWYTKPGRYYGSVFENHAPWGAKSLAFIAAALGENELFYGTETKIQASTLPDESTMHAAVNISAKGFFDQIMHAVNFAAYPRGGWHESVSYFLAKEIPELLEYAEIVCTYHDDEVYTNSVYASPLFRNAGLFLYHMTTPDGMLQKIGDTGGKTALPLEFYQPGGNTYGDVNNIGAGYLSGYFLQRLYTRLKDAGSPQHAQFVKFYSDEYCFDFNGPRPKMESNINLLYSLLWRDYSDSMHISTTQIENNPMWSRSIYFDNSGILISKNPSKRNASSTIVRFDAQPYFYGSHQHFASGHFTIFKGANLAIDGGRYIMPQTQAAKNYSDQVYRHPIAHNVLLIGDEKTGQKTLDKKSNRAPYTIQQLDPFQEYGTGPQNVSIFLSEAHNEKWLCPWQMSGMSLNLTSLYDHAGVQDYSRTLLHLYEPGQSDVILTYDDVRLEKANTAFWQLHVRDNGKNRFYSDSVYVVERDERINRRLVKSGFGDRYEGQLFVKALSPVHSSSITDFTFPDSICENCWNGRVWEESTNILRFEASSQKRHEIVMALVPTQLADKTQETIYDVSNTIHEIDTHNQFFKTIEIQSRDNKGKEKSTLYVNVTSQRNEVSSDYHFEYKNLKSGWIIFYGIEPGAWKILVKNKDDEILQSHHSTTLDCYPRSEWGVVAFPIDKINNGEENITISLIQQ